MKTFLEEWFLYLRETSEAPAKSKLHVVRCFLFLRIQIHCNRYSLTIIKAFRFRGVTGVRQIVLVRRVKSSSEA